MYMYKFIQAIKIRVLRMNKGESKSKWFHEVWGMFITSSFIKMSPIRLMLPVTTLTCKHKNYFWSMHKVLDPLLFYLSNMMKVTYISPNTLWSMHQMLKFSLLLYFFKSHCKENMQKKGVWFLHITWKKP